MDSNEAFGQKRSGEGGTTQRFFVELIPAATLHKTAAVQSLASHLANHIAKTNKTCKE